LLVAILGAACAGSARGITAQVEIAGGFIELLLQFAFRVVAILRQLTLTIFLEDLLFFVQQASLSSRSAAR
jgi:hypothetical protein